MRQPSLSGVEPTPRSQTCRLSKVLYKQGAGGSGTKESEARGYSGGIFILAGRIGRGRLPVVGSIGRMRQRFHAGGSERPREHLGEPLAFQAFSQVGEIVDAASDLG